jgi:hypothetical protein
MISLSADDCVIFDIQNNMHNRNTKHMDFEFLYVKQQYTNGENELQMWR